MMKLRFYDQTCILPGHLRDMFVISDYFIIYIDFRYIYNIKYDNLNTMTALLKAFTIHPYIDPEDEM